MATGRSRRGRCWPGCCWPRSCSGCWPLRRGRPARRADRQQRPWTDEGFNLVNARERVLAGHFATGDIDRSLTNGAYSVLAAAMFTVTGPSLAAGRALSMVAVAAAVLLLALGLARPLGRPAALLAAAGLGGANLVLEHGRLALVEATVVVLLTGAFVLATGPPGGRRWPPGPGSGCWWRRRCRSRRSRCCPGW